MSEDRPVFWFDLGSPHAWLAAERVNALFDVPPVWQPVHMPPPEPGEDDRRHVERRAGDLGLLEVRWPERWPADTGVAMRAATFAKQTGRAVAFALAAFRQAFAAGRDLGELDNVLIAAAACELHPRAVTAAIETRGVREELERGTEEARAAGVTAVPALAVGGELFQGEERLEAAAAAARA